MLVIESRFRIKVMNKSKLLSKLEDFFDSDEAKRKKNVTQIETVLEKLKNKQAKTKKMLLQCKNEDFKKALNLEIDVIDAQIKKGERHLRRMTQLTD